jgi:hypothetical protein
MWRRASRKELAPKIFKFKSAKERGPMGTIRPAPKVIKGPVFNSIWGQQGLKEIIQLR